MVIKILDYIIIGRGYAVKNKANFFLGIFTMLMFVYSVIRCYKRVTPLIVVAIIFEFIAFILLIHNLKNNKKVC